VTDTGAGAAATAATGTEERPLVHPVTGERLVFRKRASDTGGELLEFTIYMSPGGFIATPHIHPYAEERFEVAGAPVMIEVDGEARLYQPGEVAVVPPGVVHNWWNPSAEESATLIQLRPAFDMETVFETMFGLAADGKVNAKGMPNPLQMMVLARAYRREVTPPPPLRWVVGPLSAVVAPLAQRLGYLARYEKYSGPPAPPRGEP
jgi:quercetin dioxygenase-like cupin family protein